MNSRLICRVCRYLLSTRMYYFLSGSDKQKAVGCDSLLLFYKIAHCVNGSGNGRYALHFQNLPF